MKERLFSSFFFFFFLRLEHIFLLGAFIFLSTYKGALESIFWILDFFKYNFFSSIILSPQYFYQNIFSIKSDKILVCWPLALEFGLECIFHTQIVHVVFLHFL